MKELIRIQTTKKGTKAVSARDLHEFLGVSTEVILWCKRMFEYGFEADVDYAAIKSENPVNKQVTIKDFALTLDTAKELSMLQRTDKGKEARQYFIAREKQAKELEKQRLPQTFSEALQLAANQAKQLELQAPKVESFDTFIDSKSLQGFKEVANLLGLGRNKLMAQLREKKILTSMNIPYQQYLNMNLFEVKESTQSGFNVATTYVTAKGIDYIRKMILKN